MISKNYQQQLTLISATVDLFGRNMFFLPLQTSYIFERLQSLTSFEINFVVDQNKNKILACDWLSPARFEHQLESAGVMLVTGQLNRTVDMSCLCKWTVHVICKRCCRAFRQPNRGLFMKTYNRCLVSFLNS